MSKQYEERMRERGLKPTADDRLNAEIDEARRNARLDSWTSFVEPLDVPSDIYPAILTLRHQLMKAAPARALTAEECKTVYAVIAGLIETNAALRSHAERLAQLVDNWADNFKALQRTGQRIQRFANFVTEADDAAVDEQDEVERTAP